jgi:hypothetical protein
MSFLTKKKVDASHTHNLRDLVKAANLELLRFDEAKRNPIFRVNWDVVQHWSEHSRYRRSDVRMRRIWWQRLAIRNTE